MVQGIGSAPQAALMKAIQDLGQLLKDSQAMAMQASEKLLKAGVQQAVQDASVGAAIDVTA
jgi:hypothetical protein